MDWAEILPSKATIDFVDTLIGGSGREFAKKESSWIRIC